MYLVVARVVGQQDETHWRTAFAAGNGFLEIWTFTTASSDVEKVGRVPILS
jgi:hypothetical protein